MTAGLDHDCYEQFAEMLWLAECNEEAPSIRSAPPLSLAAFFNAQRDLTMQSAGRVSFFWPKDAPLETRTMNSLADGEEEPATELDAFFSLLGLSLNLEEAEAYMRDALSRGELDPEAVLGRVIQGRTLQFPSGSEQEEFLRLWRELWDEIRADYVPSEDVHREMRAIFLELNDQCLEVLRGLDRNAQDPFAVMGNPASLKLGQLSALIHSALAICNQPEEHPEAFPVPLDEMAKGISATIEELAEELQSTAPARRRVRPSSIQTFATQGTVSCAALFSYSP